MSKSVKNPEQMLLEEAGVGRGMIPFRELASWPHMLAGALHGEGERASDNASVSLALNSPFCVHWHVGSVPVLLWRGRQPEHELLCCNARVICIAAQSWGERRD